MPFNVIAILSPSKLTPKGTHLPQNDLMDKMVPITIPVPDKSLLFKRSRSSKFILLLLQNIPVQIIWPNRSGKNHKNKQ